MNEELIYSSLSSYGYISKTKRFLFTKDVASKYKRVTINSVTQEQKRFSRKIQDVTVFGSGSVSVGTDLIINIYIEPEYFKAEKAKNRVSDIQDILNRLVALELYSNSPNYLSLIRTKTGTADIIQLGNQKPKSYFTLKF